MSAIQIDHLTKRYKDVTAVNDLSLEIAEGELFSLLGVNGAGKTTTIKSVCGILQFDEGEILINNQNVQHDCSFLLIFLC